MQQSGDQPKKVFPGRGKSLAAHGKSSNLMGAGAAGRPGLNRVQGAARGQQVAGSPPPMYRVV